MQSIMRATLWAVASAAAFAASSAAAKFLGQKLPTAELGFFRALVGVVVTVGAWQLVRRIGSPQDRWGHVLRCVLGIVALYSFLYAVTTIPIGLATLLLFTRVLLLPITARAMLGERSSTGTWVAIAVGFLGTVVALWPSLALPELRWGILAGVVAALASAGSQTAVRRLTATNHPAMIVLIYTAATVAATLPLAVPVWVSPPAVDWPVIVALGLFALVAQYTAAKAYANATVGAIAPLDFLSVPAAAILGFALFAEVPHVYMIAGSLTILIAAFMVTKGKSNT